MAAKIEDVRTAAAGFCVVGTVLARGNAEQHPRLEIDEFVRDADVCNLFLLALRSLQDGDPPEKSKSKSKSGSSGKQENVSVLPEDEPWGWFRICSIYGLPAEAWQSVTEASLIASGQVRPDTEYWQPSAAPGANPATKPQADTTKGYGQHNSILFPMWHRTYVAMMEQAISLKMYEIAEKFLATEPPKPQYMEAAMRFRLPYWDPFVVRELYEPTYGGLKEGPDANARGGEAPTYRAGLPKILITAKVKVEEPSGYKVEIDNPLYRYKFPLKAKGKEPKYRFDNKDPFRFEEMFTNGGETKLNKKNPLEITPNMQTVRSPTDNGKTSHRAIEDLFSGLRGATWIASGSVLVRMLRDTNTSWENFSNKASGRMPGTDFAAEKSRARLKVRRHSIETLSDRICGWVGGLDRYRGHMSHPDWSAFDPIFWLHHCNMDRLVAIHQYLTDPSIPSGQPNSQWKQYSSSATFVSPVDYLQTPDSPLAPFRHPGSPSKFWTSAEASDHRKFGYTYHDIPSPTANRIEASRWLGHRMERLYGWFDPIPTSTMIPGLDPDTFYEPPHNWAITIQRPPPRHLTGFPIDHGKGNEKAPCLPSRVFMDTNTPIPARGDVDYSPYNDTRYGNPKLTTGPLTVFDTWENAQAERQKLLNPVQAQPQSPEPWRSTKPKSPGRP